MSRYWKKKIYEEYGVIVKRIRHAYNPLTSYGFDKKNYILYYFHGCSAGSTIGNYDRIFHSATEIVEFLENEKKASGQASQHCI